MYSYISLLKIYKYPIDIYNQNIIRINIFGTLYYRSTSRAAFFLRSYNRSWSPLTIWGERMPSVIVVNYLFLCCCCCFYFFPGCKEIWNVSTLNNSFFFSRNWPVFSIYFSIFLDSIFISKVSFSVCIHVKTLQIWILFAFLSYFTFIFKKMKTEKK